MSKEMRIDVGVSPDKDLTEFSDDWLGEQIALKELSRLYSHLRSRNFLIGVDLGDIKFSVQKKARIEIGASKVFEDGYLSLKNKVVVSFNQEHFEMDVTYPRFN